MSSDLCLKTEDGILNIRVGAIIMRGEEFLMVENDRFDHKYSVGGRIKFGETAEEAVIREVFEETGVHYEIDHLAVIHENFFNENAGSLKGLECHELALYFVMKPRGRKNLNSDSYYHGAKESMHWIHIEEIGKFKAFPSFMKDYLSREHTGVEHIVTDERK